MSGLKFGTKYNYRVFAENAAGVSDPSNTIGPLLADDTHGETDDSFLTEFSATVIVISIKAFLKIFLIVYLQGLAFLGHPGICR